MVSLYRVLGWINIAVFLVLLYPFLQRILVKRGKKIRRGARPMHKFLGVILIMSGVFHGILALGTFQLHSGVIFTIAIIFTAMIGVLYQFLKKRKLYSLHVGVVGFLVIMLLIHVIYPSIMSFFIQ